jgi:hypothetical protein
MAQKIVAFVAKSFDPEDEAKIAQLRALVAPARPASCCLSLFSLITELPNPKFARYMALAKRAVGLQFSQQVHIFLK